jgi:hypothetical protein
MKGALYSEFWDKINLKEKITLLRLHELLFGIVIVTVLSLIEDGLDFGNSLPIINVLDSNNTFIGDNPLISYPINLNHELCYPNDLSYCLTHVEDKSNCCVQLYDENSYPTELVSDYENIIMIFVIGFLWLMFRTLLWRYLFRNEFGIDSIDDRFWMKILWDSFLGMLASVGLADIAVSYIKLAVRSPRPIYYALKLYSSVHSNARSDYDGT